MIRQFRKAAILSLVLLLSVLNFGIHATTMSQASVHEMESMHHEVSTSSCAIICTSAKLHKEELTDESAEEDGNKADEPFYVHLRPSLIALLEKKHDVQASLVLKHEPPPGLPSYIALSVFRA